MAEQEWEKKPDETLGGEGDIIPETHQISPEENLERIVALADISRREAEAKQVEQNVKKYIEQMSEKRASLKAEIIGLQADKKVLITEIGYLRKERDAFKSEKGG